MEKALGWAVCIAAGILLGKIINYAWKRWFL